MRKLLGMAAILLAAASCAKDKTLKQFNDEQCANNFAELQRLDGRYSSGLFHHANSKPLGGVELTLKARQESTSGGQANAPGCRSYIDAGLTFVDSRKISLVSQDSYFNPQSGVLTINFDVLRGGRSGGDDDEEPGGGKSQYTVTLTAHVSDTLLAGNLAGVGHAAQQGDFQMEKDGATVEDLAKQFKDANPIDRTQLDYKGKAKLVPEDPSGGRNLTLTVEFPDANPAAHFIHVFFPDAQIPVQVNFGFAPEVPIYINFRIVFWDPLDGTLLAEIARTGEGGRIIHHLNCSNFSFNRPDRDITCDYWSNLASGYGIKFRPKHLVDPKPPKRGRP